MNNEELIVSYNVENFFLPNQFFNFLGKIKWDKKRYQKKLNQIAFVFSLIKEKYHQLPFLTGLCEISDKKVLEDLLSFPIFENQFGFIHYNSPDERGIDTALIYDQRKIKIIFSEPISFIFQDKNRIDTTRDVLYLKCSFQEEILHVFVLHLPSKRDNDINEEKRNYILEKIRQKIKEILSNQNESVIVLGDFNSSPDEENLIRFTKNILVNPFLYLLEKGHFSTFHQGKGLLFDQILLSHHFLKENSLLQFQKSEVLNFPNLMDRNRKFKNLPFRTFSGTRYLGGYSDHYPVASFFKVIKK